MRLLPWRPSHTLGRGYNAVTYYAAFNAWANPMHSIIALTGLRKRWCMNIAPTVILLGVALWQTTSVGAVPETSNETRAIRRPVRATALQSTSVDNQTSWIIQPDVPRIPKIAGFDSQLPPHIERRLSYAFDLAQRGATYSANAEFRAVIGLCALEADARAGGTTRREAFREGWVALDEADDFGGDQMDWHESADVRRVIADHATNVLKNSPTSMDSVEAAQAYYVYSEERLTFSCKDIPGATLAFYGLARTYVEPGMRVTHAPAKAALLQRVALAIAPQNVLARNELGVLMAQHGHLAESEQLFRQCVAINPLPETWQNLSIVYARRGDTTSSKAALAASENLASNDNAARSRTDLAAQDAGAKAGGEATGTTRKPGLLARLNIPTLHNPFRR